MSKIVRAISIVVCDPSGKQKPGETYPPGSVWMLDKERQAKKRQRPSRQAKNAVWNGQTPKSPP
jgi:hypothetical protein